MQLDSWYNCCIQLEFLGLWLYFPPFQTFLLYLFLLCKWWFFNCFPGLESMWLLWCGSQMRVLTTQSHMHINGSEDSWTGLLWKEPNYPAVRAELSKISISTHILSWITQKVNKLLMKNMNFRVVFWKKCHSRNKFHVCVHTSGINIYW